jgi:hypothetical protein
MTAKVGIAMGYRLYSWGTGVQFLATETFHFSTVSRLALGLYRASYPVGTRGSFLRGKADHSPPSKNAWNYTSNSA